MSATSNSKYPAMDLGDFTVRPIREEDVQNYFLLIESNRERIAKYFSNVTAANKDIESTAAFVVERLSLLEKEELISFVICDNLTQKVIGSIFLKNIDRKVQKAELSFFIDKNYEGKGIITKVVSLIIKYCFQHLLFNKIFLRIAEDNISSRRVAEKNGFVLEGTLRHDFKTPEGQFIDIVYYGLLNDLPRAF